MSTITREFTKEQLIAEARANIETMTAALSSGITDSPRRVARNLRLNEIALASLEAEPVSVFKIDHESSLIKHVKRVVSETNAPPATVSVPECFKRLLHHAYGMTMGHDWNKGTMAGHNRTKLCQAVEECRAAMLQGAEPVKTAYKLPANTPCKDAPEHIWLQTAGVWPENGEFSELTWCSDNQHPDDTLYVRADIVAGNSPVIADDVRRMDWLVSKTVDVREPMVYGSHSIFWSQTTTDEEDDYHATKLREQIDAAMAAEQAAAPLQDTSRELLVSVEGDTCGKHPDTQLINHPHRKTASIPPRPVKYCPKCEPGVFRLPDEWHCNVNAKYFIYRPSVISDKKITFVNSSFVNCSEPEGDIQFISCTLPAEWEGKVNAIDCVFKADLQQEVTP